MFTTPITSATPVRAGRSSQAADALANLNPWTITSGTLIGSAIIARLAAWSTGSTSVVQLALLLLVAATAALTGWMGTGEAEVNTTESKLAKLALRAGGVQTVLAVVTLFIAIS